MLPRRRSLGDDVDDDGVLQLYAKHRAAERQVADYYYYALAPYAESTGRLDLANKYRGVAFKLYECRTGGPFGMGSNGRPVVAWDHKCGCSKLCPDEARHESQRLYDRYADAIREHVAKGGRVYKMWPTLPNYPHGRLREGMKHLFKRYRDRIVRAQAKGKNKFGHVGSLAILENPLSARGDWNVHLNVIVLTDRWLSFKELREAWGCNLEMRQHSEFGEKGLHNLFGEMVKYATRTVPEKSGSKHGHGSDAPALVEWSAELGVEWHEASHGFRRTRAYGCLHGIGKPESNYSMPRHWLGRIDYEPSGYRVTWRGHSLAHHARQLLDCSSAALDLIRGDKSTTKRHNRGPP